ncbi:DUF2165 family protein (plasmid) [Deinococcus radiomollis]|uniref:DUF2165 family protein n=1 Tax=Deinococcus radiomollis TaxID=468916 RepID=UPI003891B933
MTGVLAGTGFIKAGVLLMWALWMTLVTVYNLLDALKALRLLPHTLLSSSNFALLLSTTAQHRTPRWLVWTLFWGVIVWEALASGLLWAALLGGGLGLAWAALGVSLLLWAGFVLANQFFMTWLTEPGAVTAHRSLFSMTALSLLLLYLLP